MRHSIRVTICSLALCTLYIAMTAAQASAATLALSTTQNSLCFTGDSDDDLSSPVAYDPADEACNDGTTNDTNAFAMSSSIVGNATSTLTLDVNAAVAVDANPASSEYQAGRIALGLTLEISGTSGGDWDLQIDQQMMGLLTTVTDGAGFANAGISGVTASLSIVPSLGFGASTTLASLESDSEAFSISRSGDVVSGSGDVTVTGTLEITLDAYSECDGFLCLGNADEGAVLFGVDNVTDSAFISADEYATYGRALEPDGYQLTFSLLTDPICGDGNVDTSLGEECDDNNLADEDGCSSLCLIEYCGDSVIQAGMGETCDDGGNSGGDGCSALCQLEGVVVVPSLHRSPLLLLALILLSAGVFAMIFQQRSRDRA